MKLKINGELVTLPSHIQSVEEVKKHFELNNKVVIVELNGDILEKDSHDAAKVKDGDQLEIVHFVGGG